jgi:holin-like protein
MIQALTLILLCQLAGETLTRTLGLPVPGPVLGLGAMLALLAASERVQALVAPVGAGILRHLSLFFVPAGVGVVAHLDHLGGQALALGAAILGSTLLALLAGAGAFVLVARLTGSRQEPGTDD